MQKGWPMPPKATSQPPRPVLSRRSHGRGGTRPYQLGARTGAVQLNACSGSTERLLGTDNTGLEAFQIKAHFPSNGA